VVLVTGDWLGLTFGSMCESQRWRETGLFFRISWKAAPSAAGIARAASGLPYRDEQWARLVASPSTPPRARSRTSGHAWL